MNTLIRNEEYIPHQAIVLTNQNNLEDFSLKKVRTAYQMRKSYLGKDSAIWEIEIHPTNLCNLHCNGCSYGTRHDGHSLTIEQIKAIISRYLSYDPQSIFFSGGGDPLLWKYWNEFFTLFEKPCRLGISTNMFNFKSIEKNWKFFDFYQIHVTGYDDLTVKEATGVSGYQQINNNISFLLRNKLPSQVITMKIIVDEKNFNSLSDYLDYVMREGVNSVVLKYQQDFLNNANLATDETMNIVRNTVYSHPIADSFDYVLDNLDDVIFDYPCPDTCIFANSGLYKLINATGEVFPCIAANANRESILQQEKSYIDILSQNMREGRCPLRACRHYRFSQYLFRIKDIDSIHRNVPSTPLLL